MSTTGDLIAEGKTKSVHAWAADPSLVLLRNKSHITAHDDPSFTRQFHTKAVHATFTTCAVFSLLREAKIPVSFDRQHSDTEFLAHRSTMLPLEIVARRYAVGSYLKRHPHMTPKDPKKPHRFHRLETEFFLKTVAQDFHGVKYPTDDPMLQFPSPVIPSSTIDEAEHEEELWDVVHPKKSSWEADAHFGKLKSFDVLVPGIQQAEGLRKATFKATIPYLDQLVRRVFLVLEKAWSNLGFTLIDMKIEVDSEGRVADVIDSDSWRLWKNGEAFDKQVFRDGGEAVLGEVEAKYAFVADMTKRLNVPKQVVLFWDTTMQEPDDDHFPDVLEYYNLPSVDVISWKRSLSLGDNKVLAELNDIFYSYPQGGVVVVKEKNSSVSDLVAKYSPFTVISLNEKAAEGANSGVALVARNGCFAARHVVSLLAQTNPAVYARVAS
eukprot:TRINITY_DN2558_c0_g1_i1.p1 TRINITY_DN2558_c0_g1~~TRINITY_DN2558_c0_g1_i1.p1  ORF type:complete len:437 (-),score=109.36 TRINITY_DN2558_c0_g1_i1:146-1456(-)